MKKTMALLLVFCVMFSTLLPVTIAGAEEEMKQTRVILSEDFESTVLADSIYGSNGEYNTNNDIGGVGFNDWEDNGAGNKNPTKPYDGNGVIVVAKIYDDDGNKAGGFKYTAAPNQSNTSIYKAYEVHKSPSATVSSGLVIFKMSAKPTADAGIFCWNISGQAATAAPYVTMDGKTQRIGGTIFDTGSGNPVAAIQADVWADYEFWIDFDSNKARLFVNGEELTNTRTSLPAALTQVSRLSIGLHRYQGAWAADAGWSVDNIEIIAVADLDAKIAPTDDGDLYKAKLTFNNAPTGGIDAANVSIDVDGTDYIADSIEPVEGDDKSFIVTFPTELAPGFVQYPVTLNGFFDEYGSTLEDKVITYTTRAKRYEVSDPIFYTGYGTDEELDVLSLGENGTFTVEYNIKNELPEEFSGDIILVHKRGEEVVKAVAADANVAAETRDNLVTAALEVTGYTADDKLEAYIWDSVQGMDAYKPVSTLDSTGITLESNFVTESAASDITMNAAVDFENESMVLSGAVADGVAGEVSALVFDPGYKLSDLTVENFNDAVSSIAQKATEADGSYSFSCKISNPQDGNDYYAAVGADGKTVTDNALFFVMSTVNNAVSTTSSATAEELIDLLSGKTKLDGDIPLNDVLQMELSVYNTLTHKNEVCEAFAEAAVTDVDSIRTAFLNIVTAQRAKEDRINALLARINDALWSEIEEILEEDLDGENDLALPWEGSYKEIEDNEDLLTDFYKRLASDYTFETYLQLQEVFENEAEAVKEADEEESSSSGGGGGGGRGNGKLGYSSGLASTNTLTPIVKEEVEEEVRITDFSDIEHVAWAQESIKALAEEGILSGVGGGKFAPDAKVTREQFVKMIVLAFNLYDEKATTDKFIDIPDGMWYSSYVASAVELGIVHGVDNDHFGVGKEITRAEMATILTRAAESSGKVLESGSALEYADNEQIPAYASESIAKLSKAGIMSGVGDNMFAPHDKATRAMAAKVIYMLRGSF